MSAASGSRFWTVEQIRARHADLCTATLHGPPPGDWWQRWADDVGEVLAALKKAEAEIATVRVFLDDAPESVPLVDAVRSALKFARADYRGRLADAEAERDVSRLVVKRLRKKLSAIRADAKNAIAAEEEPCLAEDGSPLVCAKCKMPILAGEGGYNTRPEGSYHAHACYGYMMERERDAAASRAAAWAARAAGLEGHVRALLYTDEPEPYCKANKDGPDEYGFECPTCWLVWERVEDEHHADDCPVPAARVVLARSSGALCEKCAGHAWLDANDRPLIIAAAEAGVWRQCPACSGTGRAPGETAREVLDDLLNESINVANLPVEAHVEWGKRAVDAALARLAALVPPIVGDFAESALEPERKAHDRTTAVLRDLQEWEFPVCTCPRVAGGPCARCRIDAALAAYARMK